MSKESKFWDWFSKHNEQYLNLHRIDHASEIDDLLENLLSHLHQYNDNLYFQIGGDDTTQELIITAEGNKQHFQDVEKLVEGAPQINQWKIIAFKPPMGFDFVTEYEGICLDPDQMWFLPLENPNPSQQIRLEIYVKAFSGYERSKYLNGVYQVLDTGLGEKFNADIIERININELKENTDINELINLKKLPECIESIYY